MKYSTNSNYSSVYMFWKLEFFGIFPTCLEIKNKKVSISQFRLNSSNAKTY